MPTMLIWWEKHRYHTQHTKALLDTSKAVGLEVNPEKTMYTLMSRYQKAGQKHSIKIVNRSFEHVVKFKYLGTTLKDKIACTKRLRTDQILRMLATIQFRVSLSSLLLSRNVKVKIYKS
jgi:hypothetical protein